MLPYPDLSIVVPFYNEEESISRLYDAVVSAVAGLNRSFEMVFVDDGSSDATFAIAEQLAKRDPRLRVVRFRRNYGQTPAMAAGIDHAAGAVIVTMDGDLQNDPSDIVRFLEKIDEGYDIVVGWRHQRKDKLITRKIPSRLANWLIGRVTGVPIRDNGCSLKAFRASLIKQIPLYSDMHRFIPAMASVAGPRIAELQVRHHARQFGKSKYGLSRIYKVLLDLLVIKTVTAFAARPAVWFAMLSLPFLLLGVAALAFAAWFASKHAGHFPMPLAGTGVILVTSAVIMVFAGAVGELVFKTGTVRDQAYARLTRMIATHEAPEA
jgi:glycosyltransferase involved in cell wall biosynthesis